VALQNIIPSLVSRVMPTAVASGLFVSLCTAQQPSGGKTPYGQPGGNFDNVAGLVNLPCMDGVLSTGAIEATEVQELEEIMSRAFRHVVLNGYYPAFFTDGAGGPGGQQKGWRVVVDGVVYNLMGAEPDSQNSQTRLKLELVVVSA
jgi:hypothetical protein